VQKSPYDVKRTCFCAAILRALGLRRHELPSGCMLSRRRTAFLANSAINPARFVASFVAHAKRIAAPPEGCSVTVCSTFGVFPQGEPGLVMNGNACMRASPVRIH
jgi:hypothetical protein